MILFTTVCILVAFVSSLVYVESILYNTPVTLLILLSQFHSSHKTETTQWDHPKMTELYHQIGTSTVLELILCIVLKSA